MVGFALDVLLISLAAVCFIGIVKSPIKKLLIKRGLKDNTQMQTTFKAVTTALSFILSFAGALIFFFAIKKVNPFIDGIIWSYTIAVVGASQTLYSIYEVYGRDGLLVVIKTALLKNATTDICKLNFNADQFGRQVSDLVKSEFEGAPDISDVVATVVKRLQNK